MGIRMSYCPYCNKYVGDILKSKAFRICSHCGKIYRTGFGIDASKSLEKKIKYLESIKYENQQMKDLEYGFYGLNALTDFETENWVYKLLEDLVETGKNDFRNSLIRKKIVLDGDILRIEDLKREEAELIRNNKSALLESLYSIGIKNVTDFKLIENYTSYEEIKNLENKILPFVQKLYTVLFSNEALAYGLIRTLKRILIYNLSADVIMNFYLGVFQEYHTSNKNIQGAAKFIKEVFKDITQNQINEILSVLLFNSDWPSRDVNTESSRMEIYTKYIKEVYKRVDVIVEYSELKENKATTVTNNSKKDINEKRFCTNCGKEIDNSWKFCNYCGNKLD